MGGFFLILLLSSTLSSIFVTSKAASTIRENQTINDTNTIVSDGESFELGFFSPSNNSRHRYLGIWYKRISTTTIVWVANRETPLIDSSGRLALTEDGNLVLVNGTSNIIWSSNSTRLAENPVAQLLDTGNLIIRNENDDDPENYLWQSFDHPGDTFLPSMKFGRDLVKGLDRKFVSWSSPDDPSPGEYTEELDPNGYPQLVVRRDSVMQYRSGPWNGLRFSGQPNLRSNAVFSFEFVSNQREIYFKYELVDSSVISRLVLTPSGSLERFTWVNQTQEWRLYQTAQIDNCDRYGLCGPYGSCNINDSPVCGCLRGFEPRFLDRWNAADWINGCGRRTPLSCENGDGFLKHSGVKLPDTRGSWFNESMSLEECETRCLANCNCTAYANTDVRRGGSGCLLWFDDLIDIREIAEDGQDIYVRMAASELDTGSKEKRRVTIVVIISVIPAVMLLIGLCLFLIIKRRKKKIEDGREDWELPQFDFKTMANATSNFSDNNKLGEGGFGPVYKGLLNDGPTRQEIAVKRHSMKSNQGIDEFKSELSYIAKLQHRNLVRILGCCIDEGERMLIYEYMPNKSLDSFIFDEEKRKSLDWLTRNGIINGIARGLLYLHQDSRLRIIHRDLKASNVLLDKEMNPKISDFGLARCLEGNDMEANTKRVIGTYGYMAPEYAIDGIFSTKSDVFSFGVLVLEIVSGKKNRGFHHIDHSHNLLGHAWKLYQNGKLEELIDGPIWDVCKKSEVYRAIHIGLLCVQKYPEDRPTMSTVVLMLSSEVALPNPKEPGFFTERRTAGETNSSSSKPASRSSNQLTITCMAPR